MAANGTIIDNKYEILALVGQGGMSKVYLARDNKMNRQLAIKEVQKNARDKNNEIVIQSAIAEANILKNLSHAGLAFIVDIIDTLNEIYIVMEYVEGESLDKVLDEYGAQPQELVIEWAKQLCVVLEYLHTREPAIIYRDMKPANIRLKPDGNLKLIDFGIAREYKEQNLADTVSLGTKGYAAPEQFGGKGQTDARTDVYCLGVTLYHLVTGQNPAEPPYELYPIRHWNPALSGGLERIIQKCTQLNPNDRYQTCAELLYALDHYEEIDDLYKKAQKRKLKFFLISAGLCVLMAIVGLTGNLLATTETNNMYQARIDISTATGYEEKIATYKEAIALIPEDTRAYMKLLEAYDAEARNDKSVFGDSESNAFSALYNEYKSNFTTSTEYLDLYYAIGKTYISLYSGGDNTFRSRVLKAQPHFKVIIDSGATDHKMFSMANNYYTIGKFYADYVVNATSVNEPTKDKYDELISSLISCVDDMESYDGEDKSYIKLSMYQEISNLLNDHRKGFAVTAVEKSSVLNLLKSVYEKADDLFVSQPENEAIQNSIRNSYSGYVDAINRAYTNTGERTQNG